MGSINKQIFVFIVCGTKAHIDTLHFSIRYLNYFSKNDILVLTDSSRNEIAVKHDKIIDISTPKSYTNHQASIFLKTAVHKFLPLGPTYCYLDTDVIALSSSCDEVFEQFVPPIIFAEDHCKMNVFSPVAMNCGCLEKVANYENIIREIRQKYDSRDAESIATRQELAKLFTEKEGSFWKRFKAFFLFNLSRDKYWISDKFYFDKKTEEWMDASQNKAIIASTNSPFFKKKYQIYFNESIHEWCDLEDQPIKPACNHLQEYIERDLDISVENEIWQHWNGGVFIFNEKSTVFLEKWHQLTLATFEMKNWKTRDQGTLIAAIWDQKLPNHPVLAPKWNFLADFQNINLDFNQDGSFTLDQWKSSVKPVLIHVYHHFGDEKWPMWNYIKSILPRE